VFALLADIVEGGLMGWSDRSDGIEQESIWDDVVTRQVPHSIFAAFSDADRFPLDFSPHTHNTEITDIVIEKTCSATSLNTNTHYLEFKKHRIPKDSIQSSVLPAGGFATVETD
jgi:hypothetical protein